MDPKAIAGKILAMKEIKDYYYLMRKNIQVLKFCVTRTSGIFSSIRVVEIHVEERLPLYMGFGGSLEGFLKSRLIPKK